MKLKTRWKALMLPGRRKWTALGAFFALAGGVSAGVIIIPNLFPFLDATGLVSTYNSAGAIHEDGAFFQSLGTNGRTCGTSLRPCDPTHVALKTCLRYGFAGGFG
ncbi:MAG TPA: hypothetical protein VGD60_02395 [Candidatus Acidoferrales bacterium]